MTPIQAVHDALVTANTSVGSRVAPVHAYQGEPFPYALISEPSELPQNHLAGFAGLDLCQVQVDFWDRTYLGADTAAREGRAALEAAGMQCIGRITDFFDGTLDPGAFRIGYTFRVWQ